TSRQHTARHALDSRRIHFVDDFGNRMDRPIPSHDALFTASSEYFGPLLNLSAQERHSPGNINGTPSHANVQMRVELGQRFYFWVTPTLCGVIESLCQLLLSNTPR